MDIFLKYPDERDIGFLKTLKNDILLQEMVMCHPQSYSNKDIKNWIKKYNRSKDSFLLVVYNSHKTAIGYVNISRFSEKNKTAYFGIVIHPDYHGQGYGTNALSALLIWARGRLGLRKILLEVLTTSVIAKNLYHKLHFREVGILKDHFLINGLSYDVLIMEKLL